MTLRTMGPSLWRPYFRMLPSVNESGWGNYEVGYIDQHGSRVVLGREVDAVQITAPPSGKISLDHENGSDCTCIGIPSDMPPVHPGWGDVASTAELQWSPYPVDVCVVRGDPETRCDTQGRDRVVPPPWAAEDPAAAEL
jgi:hypothetical protein